MGAVSMPNEQLKADLQSFAKQLGFDSCRITACRPPAHTTEFQSWLREGAAGEMAYMERGEEKRCNPDQILPGAKSIIVLALNYWQGDGARASGTAAMGRIARYAWGDDYHDVMAPKLEALDEFLTQAGGSQKWYVDTGPVWNAITRPRPESAGTGRAPC